MIKACRNFDILDYLTYNGFDEYMIYREELTLNRSYRQSMFGIIYYIIKELNNES